MNSRTIATLISTSCMVAAGGAVFAEPLALGYMPTDAKMSCDVSESGFSASWAQLELGGKPTGLGPIYDVDNGLVYVFPPDGPGLNPVLSNCDAFEWASQMFLWLTSTVTVNRLGGGHAPALPTDPVPTSADTNYVLSSEFMYRFNSGTLQPQSNGSAQVRQSKVQDEPAVDGVDQAGSNGVLFTQGANATSTGSSLVYYDVYSSRPWGYLRAANLADTSNPPFSQFPADAKAVCATIDYGLQNGFLKPKDIRLNTLIYGLLCENKVPSGGILGNGPRPTVAEVEAAIDFLSMALEVKASWVPASTVANPEQYIVQNATIPIYEDDGSGNLKQNGTTQADMAMIGIHVVGSTNGHPEMIWATFEHYSNAPSVDYAYANAADGTSTFSDMSSLPSDGWLVSDGTMDASNAEYAALDSKSGLIQPQQSGVAVTTPTNAVRLSPWGSKPGDASAGTNAEVISTNVSVINALSGYYQTAEGSQAAKDMLSETDPRMNYILTGASWGSMGAFPESGSMTNLAGTQVMANTTMETFDQDTFAGYNGCFLCHGKPASASDFAVSHMYNAVTEVLPND